VPRPPNPDLEEQILKAARKLWKKGGGNALTMRAVAEAAGDQYARGLPALPRPGGHFAGACCSASAWNLPPC